MPQNLHRLRTQLHYRRKNKEVTKGINNGLICENVTHVIQGLVFFPVGLAGLSASVLQVERGMDGILLHSFILHFLYRTALPVMIMPQVGRAKLKMNHNKLVSHPRSLPYTESISFTSNALLSPKNLLIGHPFRRPISLQERRTALQ